MDTSFYLPVGAEIEHSTGVACWRFDPGFTTDARPPPYRDAAFREELQSALRAQGLPE